MANMGVLETKTSIQEFTLEHRARDIAEKLLIKQPRIIGFGVYIWNLVATTEVVALLKTIRPDLIIVLGGPEVSYETDQQKIVALADYVITGWGDQAFPALCSGLLSNETPDTKIIAGQNFKLAEINMPYRLYDSDDIAHRLLYVEASRGCPFKCEFCLSALDKTAWPFDLDKFLDEMQALYDRGARHFKFVDRTFNLKIKSSIRILEFFLEKLDGDLFLHYEVIPDHLPEELKEVLTRFPPGSLQFEIGIQTFNPDVQARISRKQNDTKAKQNLRWLRDNTHAHIHADLIAGLPGEGLESFAQGFDDLVSLGPQEIQLGILKRLRGSVITRHTQDHDMRYSPNPPYEILSTDQISFVDMQRVGRFARYWDLIANSGRFRDSLPLLLGSSPFQRFMQFSDWLFATSGQTHQISLKRLFNFVGWALVEIFRLEAEVISTYIAKDLQRTKLKGLELDFEHFAVPNESSQAQRRSRQVQHVS